MSVIDQLETARDLNAPEWDNARQASVRLRSAVRRLTDNPYVLGVVASDGVVVTAFIASAMQLLGIGLPLAAGAGAAVVFMATIKVAGGYSRQRAGYGVSDYVAVLKAGVALMVSIMLVSFTGLAKPPAVPSLVTVLGLMATAVLLRASARGVLGILRSRGECMSRTLVIATAAGVATVSSTLADRRQGRELVGAFVPDHAVGDAVGGVPILGGVAEATAAVLAGDVRSVVVDPNVMGRAEFRQFRWAVENSGVELLIATDLHDVLPGRVEMHIVAATPLLELRVRQSRSQEIVKAAFDRLVALVLLVAAAPIVVSAMVAVRATSAGPAIFRQQRIGLDGRPFVIFKIRTMATDAETRLSSLANEDGAGPLFKLRSDPRVTRVGRFLRRFSIDELPQLLNIVRGDMSLVGPRPPLASEVAVYDSMAVHRLRVKPGLTGLWQVSGRSDLSWDQSVQLDLLYVDNWSVSQDLKILWRTARAVLRARGAY